MFVASSNPQLPIDYFTYPQMEVARSKQLHGLEYPCSDIVHDAIANRVVGIGGSTQQSECQVVVWDFESAKVDVKMRLSLAQRFQTVKLSRGGEFAFIGTQGGTIEVFDIGMQKRLDMPVVNLGDTTRSITAIDISANGRYLLAGDSQGILHYIELPIELSEYAVAPPKPLPKRAFSEPPETKSP